ncbi:hypothetical protein EBU95_21830 [bacterium]|nr:hypothetical protein [bacterium]
MHQGIAIGAVSGEGGVNVVGIQVEPVGGINGPFQADDDVGANGRHGHLKQHVVLWTQCLEVSGPCCCQGAQCGDDRS